MKSFFSEAPRVSGGLVPWQQGKKEKGAAKRRRPSMCDLSTTYVGQSAHARNPTHVGPAGGAPAPTDETCALPTAHPQPYSSDRRGSAAANHASRSASASSGERMPNASPSRSTAIATSSGVSARS